MKKANRIANDELRPEYKRSDGSFAVPHALETPASWASWSICPRTSVITCQLPLRVGVMAHVYLSNPNSAHPAD